MLPLLCMLLAPALAQDAQERARLLYTNGAALYEEGLYEQAITAFREALELSGNEKLLYNIANAQERMGDLQGARDTLNEYRIYATADERQTLDSRIRSVERRLEASKVVVLPPPPEPVPVVEMRPNTAKWVVLGVGATLAAGAGTMAAVTYASGRSFANAGDRLAYETARTLNNVAVPVAGVGAGVAVVGIVLPNQRPMALAPDLRGGATLRVRF